MQTGWKPQQDWNHKWSLKMGLNRYNPVIRCEG